MLITPAYAAVFGLLFVFLSVRTIRLRRRLQIAVGDGDNKALTKAIRAHSNFAEYAPIALVLIFFLETQTDASTWIHVLCGVLLLGRSLHAYGVSQVDEDYRFRVAGMALTFAAIISTAARILFAYAS